MATPRKPPPAPKTCEAPDCAVVFTPKLSTARFHSTTCRQRAGRARKAAEAAQATTPDPDTNAAEHGLVAAVRKELTEAGKLDTVRGQLALQLARRMSNPEESGFSAMSDRLTKLMDEVIPAPAPAPGTEPLPSDDEVTKARAARDAKLAAAREAADRA